MEILEINKLIKETLHSQYYGVYNTIRNEQPHSALVSFAPTQDMSKIIILTPKNTRKYVNTQLHHKVTLFISDTTNNPDDLSRAITISVLGTAEVSEKLDLELLKEFKKIFLEKNKYMESLAESIQEMIVISVDSYEVTKNFQKSVIQTNKDMTTLKIRQLPGKALGKGIIRGKVIKVNSLSELQKDSENSIVVMSEILESENFAKVKGLITGQSTIPMQIENTLKSNSIPTIFGLGNLIDSIKSGDELTINELLDLVIFHELKY